MPISVSELKQFIIMASDIKKSVPKIQLIVEIG